MWMWGRACGFAVTIASSVGTSGRSDEWLGGFGKRCSHCVCFRRLGPRLRHTTRNSTVLWCMCHSDWWGVCVDGDVDGPLVLNQGSLPVEGL